MSEKMNKFTIHSESKHDIADNTRQLKTSTKNLVILMCVQKEDSCLPPSSENWTAFCCHRHRMHLPINVAHRLTAMSVRADRIQGSQHLLKSLQESGNMKLLQLCN